MSVSEILAQAPLLLCTILSKQKNMGQPPLVPFLTTFKPLETGDIVIEVSTILYCTILCYTILYYSMIEISKREDNKQSYWKRNGRER